VKTENDFNKYVTKQVRLLGTSVSAVKFSDRFKAGVSDWMFFKAGMAAAVEAKFIKDLPGPKASLALKHPVSGPQITFLRKMTLCGVRSFVFLGIGSLKKIILIRQLEITDSGNFSPEWVREKLEVGPVFSFHDVEGIVDYIFIE